MQVHEEFSEEINGPRTIVYHFDGIADILHFIINVLNPDVYSCYFVVDSVGERQELRSCHPNFLLCQFVQPYKRILDISLSQELLQIFF